MRAAAGFSGNFALGGFASATRDATARRAEQRQRPGAAGKRPDVREGRAGRRVGRRRASRPSRRRAWASGLRPKAGSRTRAAAFARTCAGRSISSDALGALRRRRRLGGSLRAPGRGDPARRRPRRAPRLGRRRAGAGRLRERRGTSTCSGSARAAAGSTSTSAPAASATAARRSSDLALGDPLLGRRLLGSRRRLPAPPRRHRARRELRDRHGRLQRIARAGGGLHARPRKCALVAILTSAASTEPATATPQAVQ